jgi:two-component system, sensor histidine kinase and response regulator
MAGDDTGGRVFIVDDNDINLDLIASVLERRGYDVHTAVNGVEALQRVHVVDPELILLDINMPEMTGYEVCEQLKQDERVADVPVIFISAMDDLRNVVKGFDVGGVDYITKPFKAKEVIARVNSQLQIYRAKKQIELMHERDRHQFRLIDQMRQRFIGSATHDLKNPLFIIGGYVDMLATNPPVANDPESMEFIEAIRRGIDKMQTLVFDMLDLLEAEKQQELTIDVHDLAQIVQDNLRDVRVRADDKNISFAITADAPLWVSLDADKITRVLDNLVSNAIKYTPENGHVRVDVRDAGDYVTIVVQDTGLGIPEEMLPMLFTPFERVNTAEHKAQEGTGLGLSIVKAIVEQHGGTIAVESTLGVGSSFIVTLPKTVTIPANDR